MLRTACQTLALILLLPLVVFGQQERVAVFVGVNVYPKPGFEPLKYAERDIELTAAEFRKLGFKVVVMKGSLEASSPLRATKANIVRQIETLMEPLDGDDTCVVMFSGHGLQFKPPGQPDEDAFFCPVDAVKNRPETLLSLNYVIDTLLDPHVGHKLLIVDACRNEPKQVAAAEGKGIQGSDKISLPSKTAVFFSCSAKEQSFETSKLGDGSGTFTYCLLDGLRGGAADDTGQLTWSRLVAHVEDKMESEEVRNLAPRQQPVQAGNAGRVVLGKVALAPNRRPVQPVPAPSTPIAGGFEGKSAGDAKELAPGTKFRWCPAGTFTMGTVGATDDEAPVQVTLSRGFWLCETEVTQGQFRRVMQPTPWKGELYVKEGSDYAASYISYDEAVAYCETLTAQERSAGRLPAGWNYTLPTEAQWEYACRAGTTTEYSFGDEESRLGDYGWWGGLVGEGNAKTEQYAHRVGQKKSNPWGLQDMHGNVWEWCADWYEVKLPGGRDPVGASSGSSRVNRGGSWYNRASYCRSAFRRMNSPDYRSGSLGFRVAGVPSSE